MKKVGLNDCYHLVWEKLKADKLNASSLSPEASAAKKVLTYMHGRLQEYDLADTHGRNKLHEDLLASYFSYSLRDPSRLTGDDFGVSEVTRLILQAYTHWQWETTFSSHWEALRVSSEKHKALFYGVPVDGKSWELACAVDVPKGPFRFVITLMETLWLLDPVKVKDTYFKSCREHKTCSYIIVFDDIPFPFTE